jgi:hypothetical protein
VCRTAVAGLVLGGRTEIVSMCVQSVSEEGNGGETLGEACKVAIKECTG